MTATRHPVPSPTPRRRAGLSIAAAAASLALVGTAACGQGDGDGDGASAEVGGVNVSGEYGADPTVEFEAPLEDAEAASAVVDEGDGEELAEADVVNLDYWVYSGETGEQLETSRDSQPITLALSDGQATPGLIEALVGAPLESRVVAVVPPPPEAAEGAPGAQTLVFVMDLLGTVAARAEGTAQEAPDGVPVVQTDDEGDVTEVDVSGVEPPAELVTTTLIEGDGEPVPEGATVTIHYEGLLASDGTVFDSSWDRDAPATFPLAGLIPAWREAIPGLPVGSRVVLQVPPELGYGADGNPPTIPPDADLVFVIDVLAATPPAEEPSAPTEPSAAPSS
ncbi:FKBP-type peptidyl-prolyl cis-trans isomerase [Aquipuribacter sp. SD81]|uniref:FKBP-type peptidyl-prolyl cis-trans isomerase n=1 Tax=Aquipuribacter sp. SD81 TaxID=3127703 RepID=UPI003016AEB7